MSRTHTARGQLEIAPYVSVWRSVKPLDAAD